MNGIRFKGEHFNTATYEIEERKFDSWQELAEAEPWALIDPTSLSDAQREILITEMKAHSALEAVKNGDEQELLLTDPFDPEAPALPRFTANNLQRLLPEPDLLKIAEGEAAAFLVHELGTFRGLPRTYVQRRGKKWKAVTPELHQSTPCEQLPFLYTINLAKRLSPVWHAVAILVEAEDARLAAAQNDVQRAIRHAFLAGESRKSLSVKLVKAEKGANGGRTKGQSQKVATNHTKIRAATVEMRNRNPTLTDNQIAVNLAATHQYGVGARQIRRIIKDGHEGS